MKMKRLLKIVASVLGLLIVLVGATGIAIVLLFDPNDYKDEITALIEQRTGRKLTLTGPITLSVFPWLGIEAGALALGNAPGFGSEPFLRSNKAAVRVRLLPLFRKTVEMDQLSLQEVRVDLARNKQGKTNWEDLVQSGGAGGGKPHEESPLFAAFALGGIDLTNAEVHWQDRLKDEYYSVRGLNLKTGKILPDEPLDLDLSFRAETGKLGIGGIVEIKSTVDHDRAAEHYALVPLDLRARVKGPPIPGGEADIILHTDIEADLNTQLIKLPELVLETRLAGENLPQGAVDLKLTGRIDADLKNRLAKVSDLIIRMLDAEVRGDLEASRILSDVPGLQGHLAVQAPELPTLLKGFGQEALAEKVSAFSAKTGFNGTARKMVLAPLHIKAALTGAHKAPAEVRLEARANIDRDNQTLALDDLSIQGLGLDVKGTAQAQGSLTNPSYRGTFKFAPFNLRELLNRLSQEPPLTADPTVLTKVAVDTGLTASSNSLDLKPLSLQLDQSQISGNLSMVDLAKTALKFKLVIDRFNADRYLPPANPGESPRAATPAAAAGAAAQLPLSLLRTLKVKGDLNIGKLKIAKARIRNLNLKISAQEGDIKLNPISANLYQGKYSGDIGLDARGEQAILTLTEALTGIHIEPLLTDFRGKAKLSGVGDVKARLNATGADMEAFKQTLSGTAEFAFRDGALKGINLGLLIRKAQTGFVGPAEAQVQTDFSTLQGTLNLAKGVISNNDLQAKSPLLRIEGEGSANLVTEQLDYTLHTTIVATAEGQGGKELENLKGLTIPIRVSGTFSDPKYRPDLASIVKARAKKELENQQERLKSKAEEKLKDKLGKDLFRDILQ
jgi:AsmA protein